MILDETKGQLNINMSGKEYLQYRKYQDNKPALFGKKTWKSIKRMLYNFRYFISALFIYALGSSLINMIFYVEHVSKPVNFGVFVFNGFVIPYLMVYGLVFMIGVAWIIHGFGFIIVKR